MNTLYEQNTKRFNYLSRILTIARKDVNEDGIFTVCSILNHILTLNDETIVQATGDLDYTHMHIAWHHIEFAEKVLPGDTLLLESRSMLSNDVLLETEITVRKKNKGKTILVAKGNFVITIQTADVQAAYNYESNNLLTIQTML